MTGHLRLVEALEPLANHVVELTDQAGAFELAYGRYLGLRLNLINATPENRTAARALCDAARDRFATEVATYLTMAKRYDNLI